MVFFVVVHSATDPDFKMDEMLPAVTVSSHIQQL